MENETKTFTTRIRNFIILALVVSTMPRSHPTNLTDSWLYAIRAAIRTNHPAFELESELLSYKLDAFKMFKQNIKKKLLPVNRRQRNLDFLNILPKSIIAHLEIRSELRKFWTVWKTNKPRTPGSYQKPKTGQKPD